jgi:UDP-GlcNAc:undecaprenyl-phosphate GlcNAc-1-phosphate transferase
VTEHWWIDPLATALIVAAMLWVLEPLAYRLGLLDHPGGRKDHPHPTPIIGGIAMALGILAPVIWDGSYPASYLGFMIGGALLVVVGLVDDVIDVRWYWRVLVQVTAALAMIYIGGVRVEYLGQFGGETLTLDAWSVPFTVIATVGVINAFNMCDGVDGLAGSLAVAALSMYCAAAVYSGNTFMVDRLSPVIAAVAVFLLFNLRHPWRSRARVFMGNAGSAFLGYLIAWTCFRLTQNEAHPVTPALAPWLVAPPIIDCLALIVRRLKEGRSPFAAGRDHMHHLLLDAGFSPTEVALGLTAVSLAMGASAAVALRSDRVPEALLVIFFVVLTLAYYRFSRDRERAVGVLRRVRRLLPSRRVDAGIAGTAVPPEDAVAARVAVIGLGQSGLPLAVAAARQFPTIGYDLDPRRIESLREGRDTSLDVPADALLDSPNLRFTDALGELAGCNVFIIAVPCDSDGDEFPAAAPQVRASAAIGSVLKPGDLVVYESSAFPGATEALCVPALEAASGLAAGADFGVGFSPAQRRIGDAPKVTAGSTPQAAEQVDALYRAIAPAGTHRAPALRVAEAAGMIGRVQREANVALMNELALALRAIGLDTAAVRAAAATQPDALAPGPGLSGAADARWLAAAARDAGYAADLLPAAVRANAAHARRVVAETLDALKRAGRGIDGARVLLLGVAAQEDAGELHGSRAVGLVAAFRELGARVDVYDPLVDEDAGRAHGIELLDALPADGSSDAVVVCVAHREFRDLGIERVRALARAGALVHDLTGRL